MQMKRFAIGSEFHCKTKSDVSFAQKADFFVWRNLLKLNNYPSL